MDDRDSECNILVVDDNNDDYVLTSAYLSAIEKPIIHPEWAPNYQDALQKLTWSEWDTVFVDYNLGPQNGIQLIQEAISYGVASPLIMLTGHRLDEVDIEAMRAGAYLCVSKDEVSSPLLEHIIHYAKARQRTEKLLEHYNKARTEKFITAIENLQVLEEGLRTQLDETLRSQVYRETTLQQYWFFEFSPIAYFLTDRFGVTLYTNSAAAALLNRRKDHLIGKPLVVFIPLVDRPAFRSKVNQIFQTQNIQEWDLQLQIGLDTIWVNIVASPIRGQDGNIISIHWLVYQK
jgi:PAS domain S-box-containing protein